MTAPAPDPVPEPVAMSKRQAREVLLTIAALHGGTVNGLMDFAALEFVGYAWAPTVDHAMQSDPTWCWSAIGEHCRRLLWISPKALGRQVLPTGRIDRGLGSIGVSLSRLPRLS